jgi:hypothetical protein
MSKYYAHKVFTTHRDAFKYYESIHKSMDFLDVKTPSKMHHVDRVLFGVFMTAPETKGE